MDYYRGDFDNVITQCRTDNVIHENDQTNDDLAPAACNACCLLHNNKSCKQTKLNQTLMHSALWQSGRICTIQPTQNTQSQDHCVASLSTSSCSKACAIFLPAFKGQSST